MFMNKIISSLHRALTDINQASVRMMQIQTDLQDPRHGARGASRQF
jgi:hypothetical protein